MPSVYFIMYRVFIKYCVFSSAVVIFLNSASYDAALVFDLPLCTHTDTEGKPRESGIYFKIFDKNTIFNEHPVPMRINKRKARKQRPTCPPLNPPLNEWDAVTLR